MLLKKVITVILLYFLTITVLHSQNIEWKKSFRGDYTEGVDRCHTILLDELNNTIYSGGFFENNEYDYDLVIMKNDMQTGETIWSWINKIPDHWYSSKINGLIFDSTGQILAVGAESSENDPADAIVVKLDAETGNVIWKKNFNLSTPQLDKAFDITIDNNNDVIFSGAFGNGNVAIFAVVKLDGDTGEKLWDFFITDAVHSVAYEVEVDETNDVFAAGEFASDNSGEPTNFQIVLRLDGSTGNEKWRFRQQGTDKNSVKHGLYDMTLGAENLYITGLLTDSLSAPEMSVSKINKEAGELIWTSLLHNPSGNQSRGLDMVLDDDENIYVSGYINNELDIHDYTIVKFDGETGDIPWQYIWPDDDGGFNDEAIDIVYNGDGAVIATGTAWDGDPFEFQEIATVKLDISSGDVIWKLAISDDDPYLVTNHAGYSVKINSLTGDVFIGGWMVNAITTHSDYTLIKISESVVSAKQIENEIPENFELFQNYPNPFNPTTSIGFSLHEQADVILEVYNLLGEKVRTLVNSPMEAGYHNVDFNAGELCSGTYIYKIRAGNFTKTAKMLLLK